MSKKKNNWENKIELLSCPKDGINCDTQRSYMNLNLFMANEYFKSKEYHIGINCLKEAYNSTFQLQKNSCLNCSQLFRDTIADTCAENEKEMRKMSGSFFRKRKHKHYHNLFKQLSEKIKKNQPID